MDQVEPAEAKVAAAQESSDDAAVATDEEQPRRTIKEPEPVRVAFAKPAAAIIPAVTDQGSVFPQACRACCSLNRW